LDLGFASILLYVGSISAYDGYLVIRTGDIICDFKQSPVGPALIKYNTGAPTLFLHARAVGMALILIVLIVLNRFSQRLALPVPIGIALFAIP
jgi:hypothetical protein